MPYIKLVIRAFRAIDNLEVCQKYVEGHMKVLKIFGITMITSANIDWFLNPNTYVILVESEDGEKVYGGARIQLYSDDTPLPIETAVIHHQPDIHNIVKRYNDQGRTGELCGLWNSREVAGLGVGSIYLGRVAMALIPQLKLSSLFALCAPATVKNSCRVGFEVAKFMGNDGTFYYPKEDLLATSVVTEDTLNLPAAEPDERSIIMDLRNNLTKKTTDIGPKGREIEIDYNLNIIQ